MVEFLQAHLLLSYLLDIVLGCIGADVVELRGVERTDLWDLNGYDLARV